MAGRRRLVRELSEGRLGYLHIPDMMGEGWAHFHRDLQTEMDRDGLIFDVRGNSGGHISQLVVEKLARRVIGWCLGRWLQPEPYPREARRGPLVTVADEFAGSDGDIVTAAVKLLGLGPVVGTRTWGGVIGIEGRQGLVDGTTVTVPRFAFHFDQYGWGVENHGVDPDVEVLITPDDAAAGRDPQLETAVQLALDALDKQPPPALPEVATGPVKARRPLPPRQPRARLRCPGRLPRVRCLMIADPGQLRVRRIRALTVMFCVAAAVLTADAISKAQVLGKLAGHPPVRLLHGLVTLDLRARGPRAHPSRRRRRRRPAGRLRVQLLPHPGCPARRRRGAVRCPRARQLGGHRGPGVPGHPAGTGPGADRVRAGQHRPTADADPGQVRDPRRGQQPPVVAGAADRHRRPGQRLVQELAPHRRLRRSRT